MDNCPQPRKLASDNETPVHAAADSRLCPKDDPTFSYAGQVGMGRWFGFYSYESALAWVKANEKGRGWQVVPHCMATNPLTSPARDARLDRLAVANGFPNIEAAVAAGRCPRHPGFEPSNCLRCGTSQRIGR